MTGPNVFAPEQLGPVTLRNRVVKAATFEGRTPEALVTDELVDYHLAVARGGVGMTTVAYLAVAPEGRTDRHQIHLREEALPGLARLTEAVHAEGAAVAAQLGHAGPVANARSNQAQALSASRMLSPLSMRMVRSATRADLVKVTRQYVDGARIAMRAGFDALEIHLGHNYLFSSFLSPNLNRRKDELGGSLTAPGRLPAAGRQGGARHGRRRRRGDREDQHARRCALGAAGRRQPALRAHAAGGRRPRRDPAVGGQLADEPDVHVPRRRAAAGVLGGDAARRQAGDADGGSPFPALLPVRGGVPAAAWRGSSATPSTCH